MEVRCGYDVREHADAIRKYVSEDMAYPRIRCPKSIDRNGGTYYLTNFVRIYFSESRCAGEAEHGNQTTPSLALLREFLTHLHKRHSGITSRHGNPMQGVWSADTGALKLFASSGVTNMSCRRAQIPLLRSLVSDLEARLLKNLLEDNTAIRKRKIDLQKCREKNVWSL